MSYRAYYKDPSFRGRQDEQPETPKLSTRSRKTSAVPVTPGTSPRQVFSENIEAEQKGTKIESLATLAQRELNKANYILATSLKETAADPKEDKQLLNTATSTENRGGDHFAGNHFADQNNSTQNSVINPGEDPPDPPNNSF